MTIEISLNFIDFPFLSLSLSLSLSLCHYHLSVTILSLGLSNSISLVGTPLDTLPLRIAGSAIASPPQRDHCFAGSGVFTPGGGSKGSGLGLGLGSGLRPGDNFGKLAAVLYPPIIICTEGNSVDIKRLEVLILLESLICELIHCHVILKNCFVFISPYFYQYIAISNSLQKYIHIRTASSQSTFIAAC